MYVTKNAPLTAQIAAPEATLPGPGATKLCAPGSVRCVPLPIDVSAPFTEKDSHNGLNKVLSVGQQITVVLQENPTTGRRWASPIRADDPWFEPLGDQYIPSPGGAIGGGGAHVFRFRVRGDGFKYLGDKTSEPAALPLYQLAPGESLQDRMTRGDGSGPEFWLNTVILRGAKTDPIGVRK
jgi:predicted secreted protein